MIVKELYIASAASWLPELKNGARMESKPPESARGSEVRALVVEQRHSASEMAIEAVRKLVSFHPAGLGAVDALLHASTYHQGQDLAPLASTILEKSVGGSGLALEIKQMSNGGLCAMHLAACMAAADPQTFRQIVLTAGERYCLPGIDRWRTDPGTPYGDGAAAILLTQGPGRLRIVSIALTADSSLQALHRSNSSDTIAPFVDGGFVQFDRAKKAFMQDNTVGSVINRVSEGQAEVIRKVLTDTKLRLRDINHFILPHFGKRRLVSIYGALGIPLEKTEWDWSRNVGHLGAADQFAGLSNLLSGNRIESGQKIMLLSVGAGYTWGAAILDVC